MPSVAPVPPPKILDIVSVISSWVVLPPPVLPPLLEEPPPFPVLFPVFEEVLEEGLVSPSKLPSNCFSKSDFVAVNSSICNNRLSLSDCNV